MVAGSLLKVAFLPLSNVTWFEFCCLAPGSGFCLEPSSAAAGAFGTADGVPAFLNIDFVG